MEATRQLEAARLELVEPDLAVVVRLVQRSECSDHGIVVHRRRTIFGTTVIGFTSSALDLAKALAFGLLATVGLDLALRRSGLLHHVKAPTTVATVSRLAAGAAGASAEPVVPHPFMSLLTSVVVPSE